MGVKVVFWWLVIWTGDLYKLCFVQNWLESVEVTSLLAHLQNLNSLRLWFN